MTGPD